MDMFLYKMILFIIYLFILLFFYIIKICLKFYRECCIWIEINRIIIVNENGLKKII